MSVDMSGVLGERLEKALAEARRLEAAGDKAKAARVYARGAKLMGEYAETATSDTVKHKRRADAEKLRAYGEQLKQGRIPVAETGGAGGRGKADGADGKATDSGGAENSYIENARGLIRQADVDWDDIAGLDDVQRFVKESYGLALAKRPMGVKLPRAANLLLYGPPGTGKTLIAAAVSKGLEATFFSCKVSDMLSKYFGESSKLIDAVFELAGQMSPSVVFLDDFESLVGDRDADGSGAERRVLTELLACMDGFESKAGDKLVLVVAATNKPWLIDSAILSRFGKLAYVGLPDEAARETIFRLQLVDKGYRLAGSLAEFARLTEGYSGRELEQVCKELIRSMISDANPDLADTAEKGRDAVREYELKVAEIGLDGLEKAMANIRPVTTRDDLARYERWGNRR